MLSYLTSLSPEQLAGIGAALAAVGAAAVSAWRQAHKPDATESEKSGFGSVVRLHRDDRDRIDWLGERVSELSRNIKNHGDQIEDHANALRRRGGR